MGGIEALFRRRRRHEDGWLAIQMRPGALDFVHGVTGHHRPRIVRCGSRKLEDGERSLERIAKELELQRYNCLAVLAMDEYQVLQVDAPSVPPAELKPAVRWRLKDMLDYHINDATIDVLDIPPDHPGAGRAHSMYAIAAKNDVIQACISKYEAAKIPITVIDIAETAQRNVAALYEVADRALALLHIGPGHSLLTVNYRGELYMARRIEVSASQATDAASEIDEVRGRVLLQLQRSFDHFDRQFPQLGIAKLVLAPEQAESGLAAFLGQNLDLPVEQARLGEVLDIDGEAALDQGDSWRLFHLLGASLRSEAKAL